MYLFDAERTGRVTQSTSEQEPLLLWKKNFLQRPARAAESTPCFDENGNIYFGCHDGSFYSLTPDGVVRWQFITADKIYSSPVYKEGKVVFCCNQSDLVCLDASNGNLIWGFTGYNSSIYKSRLKRGLYNLISYFQYDYERKVFMKINAWASPNLASNNLIVSCLYGVGVVAVDFNSGEVRWKFNLGVPYYHLAGVAIHNSMGSDLIFAVSQNGTLFCLDSSGKLKWQHKPGFFMGNAWGNPSVDSSDNSLYYTISKKNSSAELYKVDFEGNLIWKRKFNCGIRATCSISNTNFIVVPLLDGNVCYVAKSNGEILYKKVLASRDRGLWTSATILLNDYVLINTKETTKAGSLICLDSKANQVWKMPLGKALMVPVVNKEGNLFTSTWNGDFFKFKLR